MTISTVDDCLQQCANNVILHEVFGNSESCWLGYIPINQSGRMYIKLKVFKELLRRELIEKYHAEVFLDYRGRERAIDYYKLAEG